jgi:competence protein ComEC
VQAGSSSPLPAPLAVAAASFAAGILLADHLDRSIWLWFGGALSLACCAIVASRFAHIYLARLAVIAAVVCAGAFGRSGTPPPRLEIPPAQFINGDEVLVTGFIASDAQLLPGGDRQRMDVTAESIKLGSETFNRPTGLRVTFYPRDVAFDPGAESTNETTVPLLSYGQRLRFTAKLRPPRNFKNPGAFDYEGYLRGLGIAVVGSGPAEKLQLLPGNGGTRLGRWRSVVRRSLMAHITGTNYALWSRNDAAIFAAMIIGEDSLLLRDVREEFQATGVYHLLVVSGMNVGLLAFTIFWLARRSRAPEWLASAITGGLACFYAYVAGMGVPIQRAVLMLCLYLIARLFYRGRAPLNATGFAALIVLVISPQALYEAGFQLTFLALVAIAGISVPILERTSEPVRKALLHLDSTSYDLGLAPLLAQLRLDLRLTLGRLERFIGSFLARWLLRGLANLAIAVFEIVVVSAITQATLVLPMRAYFHRTAIIGLPANVLVLPMAALMLNSGVAAIALSYISIPFARAAGWIASLTLHWTLACLTWLGHFHISIQRVPDPNMTLGITAALAVLIALALVPRRPAAVWTGLAVLFASAGVCAFYTGPPLAFPHKLEVTAIDVGQADSILVLSPEGKTMLVDAGGSLGPVRSEFDYGEDVISPFLWRRGIDRLDVVVLTHAHADHIAGLARIIENFRPRELWVGRNPETRALKRVYKTAARDSVTVQAYAAGEARDWGGTQIRFLSPPANWIPKVKADNNDSLTFLVTFEHSTALLAGDVQKKIEDLIVGEKPRADLLKVAHHGSATSTTPEFLAAVQPKLAVISVGRNTFGHPRVEVLERLQQKHVQTYRTDRLGAVTFLLGNGRVEAVTLQR